MREVWVGERRNPVSPVPPLPSRQNHGASGFDPVLQHPYRMDPLPGGYLESHGCLNILTRTAVEEETGKSRV